MKHVTWAIVMMATLVIGGRSETPAPPSSTSTSTPDAAASIASVPTDALAARAAEAISQQRHFAPAGDNAAELLLALRDRGRATPGDAVALAELQPFLVIAIEQAVERRNAAEAHRLVELLARMDAAAPAIPRLQAAVRGVEAEAARAAAVASTPVETETPEPQVPAAPAARAPAAVPRPVATEAPPASNVPPPSAPPQLSTPSSNAVASAPAPAATAAPTPVDEPPMRTAPALRLVQDAQPRYPARALERRLDGRVELTFTVRPDGSVTDIRVIDAQPAGIFDQAAVAAARRWRFAPIASEATTTRALRFTPPRG